MQKPDEACRALRPVARGLAPGRAVGSGLVLAASEPVESVPTAYQISQAPVLVFVIVQAQAFGVAALSVTELASVVEARTTEMVYSYFTLQP